MQIDLFDIDEYDDLIALWERCGLPYDKQYRDTREAMERQVYDDCIIILTLKTDDSQLIGSVIGSHDGRKGWINRLAVDPEYRGRRLAARLIDKAEEELYNKGVRIFAALIEEENFPSMAAFTHCGYDGSDCFVYFRKVMR